MPISGLFTRPGMRAGEQASRGGEMRVNLPMRFTLVNIVFVGACVLLPIMNCLPAQGSDSARDPGVSILPSVPLSLTASHRSYLPIVARMSAELPANLLMNGDFEYGDLQGWDNAGGSAISSAIAHSGRYSARITYTGSGSPGIEQVVNTQIGKTYKLTGWVRIVGESGEDWGGFRLAVISWDWQGTQQSPWLIADDLGAGWVKVAVAFTATTRQTRIQVGYFGGPGRSMTVHVDDLAFFETGVNRPPQITAGLSPRALSSLPQTQQFDLVGDDPDGAIVRVVWDFGDGTRALSQSGSRRAALPGSFVARVLVADDDGAVVTVTIPWTAARNSFPAIAINSPPQPETTADVPQLTVSGTASGSGIKIVVSTDRGFQGAASGTTRWSADVPLKPGLNRILAQVTDGSGRVQSAERLVRYAPREALNISNVAASSPTVQRWEPIEITFALNGSAATHPQFPFDPAPPPGLEWLDGMTVDALFTPDDWQTIYRRPAFLNQRYQRALKDDQEWLYPTGDPVWTARFAPPETGTWKYRIEAREAKGFAQSTENAFSVIAPANPNNHGPVRIAPNDSRYFQHADGTPFVSGGHGIGFSSERFSFDAVDVFDAIGAGNQRFFRWWIAGQVWGSAWYPWASRTLPYEGTVPATGLTVDRAYGNGLAALRLDADNPIMFQGFLSGHAGLIPGRTYRVMVRWRTEDVSGPQVAGRPYGATVKFVGWPEPGQTESIPALVPHIYGDTAWHVATADFVAEDNFLPNLALILENATGGAAYVDECAVREVLPAGTLGPQLLRTPKFNAHLEFDSARGAGMDAIFTEADARGMAFKLVISEKQEFLLNHLGPDGLPDRHEGHFDNIENAPTQRLHEYYWRHLRARFGAYRSIHSWELVNEAAPGPGDHFRLTSLLAQQAAADGNPHLATTSTWATLAEDAWNAPESAPISYADFHAYVRSSGWIGPKDELAGDSARFFHEYDLAALAAGFGKPVVWGEQGIDGISGSNEQEPLLDSDQNGIWLHKLTWARTGSGGVYPLYWYTDLIFGKSLHGIYGGWNRFMADIPLTNGYYSDAQATSSNPDIRIFGQKDTAHDRAHLWIDNRSHTWRRVVDGQLPTPSSGTVTVAGFTPHATLPIQWWNTCSGQSPASCTVGVSSQGTVTVDGAGRITLNISNLITDTAVKIGNLPSTP